MCAIVVKFQLLVHMSKRLIVNEAAQEFVMGRSRFVRAGEQRVDHPEFAFRPKPLRCDSLAFSHVAIVSGGTLKRAQHSRPDRDDSTMALRPANRGCRRSWNVIRFIERQPGV